MIVVIGGTTASGKSEIAVEVAKKLNGEIISADSMQIYRGMDIGTAKITEEEKQGVPHYMIDIVDPKERFSTALYAEQAEKIIAEIEKKGKVPILAGGTGLYISSVLHGYQNGEYNEELREELNREGKILGAESMWQKLNDIDPLSASKIHPNNQKRVVRAIEYKILTGKSIAEQSDKQETRPNQMYTLTYPRDILYERINKRVELMAERGLTEEVKGLLASGVDFSCQSMQAIGYKEFKGYFEGTKTMEQTIEEIKQHSRNYAKRQLTWFRGEKNCQWFENGKKEEIISEICTKYYKNRANL